MEEKNRINKFIEAVMKVAKGDYSAQIEPSGKNDDLDSLATGLNMMIDNIRSEITEHKKKEEVLRESEEKYRELVNTSIDGVISVDHQMRTILWNPGAEKIFQFTEEEMLGKSLIKIVPEIHRDAMKKGFIAFQENGSGPVIGKTLEIKGLRKDGTEIPIELSLSSRRVGETYIATAIVRDITQHKRAEEELTSSEERLRILFEYAPDAYYLNDLKGSIIDGNKAAENMMGYKRQELAGKSFLKLKLLSLDQIPRAAKLLAKNALGKSTGPDEFILNRKDGSQVTAEIRTFPVKIKGKTLVLGIARDITERKKAEEALIKAKEQAEKYLDISKVMMAAVDEDEKIIMINKKGCKDLCYKEKELMGKNWFDLLVPESIRKDVRGTFDKLMAGKVKPVEYYENPLLTKKGEERLFAFHNTILKDEKNNINGALFSAEDITERKRAEVDLKNSEERYRNLVEMAGIAILTDDENGNIIFANKKAAELYGYSIEEMKNLSIQSVVPPDEIKLVKEYHEDRLRGKEIPSRYESKIIKKDGSIIHVELDVVELKEKERIIGTRMYLKDITERKRAEEQIKRSLEEKEFLLGEIHHRVKNNMQVISSLLRIQASNIKDEKILEMFNVIHGRIRSMSLLYEMLYKSRDMARIDLSEYIRGLTTHLFSMYRAKVGPVSLKLNVKDVYLDAKRAIPCGLIITELVSNSLKHAFPNGKKGEISVEMFSDRGKKFSLIIRDTGRGFPEGLDFHETESLGMQLVTGLVDQIDGTIKLNRAKGTEFKIVF